MRTVVSLWNAEPSLLEKIRFSITRLKLSMGNFYRFLTEALEKIRFSITRLKREVLNMYGDVVEAWKDKILDYEIET